jgi:hypothetical protein
MALEASEKRFLAISAEPGEAAEIAKNGKDLDDLQERGEKPLIPQRTRGERSICGGDGIVRIGSG